MTPSPSLPINNHSLISMERSIGVEEEENLDLESQSHLLEKEDDDGSSITIHHHHHHHHPWNRWRSIILILRVRRVFISSTARNKMSLAAVDGIGVSPPPPPPSPSSTAIQTSDSAGDGRNVELTIISTLSQVSLEAQSDGFDESNKCNKELQNAEMAKIVKAKNLNSLKEFGGVQGFAEALDTDLENGLPNEEEDLCCRRVTCPQSETKAPQEGFFHILLNACNKYIILLLLLCAILSIVFGIQVEGLDNGWYEGAFIICAIIVLVSVPMMRKYWYLWNQSRRRKLSKNKEIVVDVFRGGDLHQISISNVVSGDIVCLKAGDQIPADGLFISGESLKLDEELQSNVDDQNPFMFYGAKVTNGKGNMLVISIGKDTMWGEMMSNVTNTPNPLQVQLDRLNSCIQITGVLISITILVVLFLRFKFDKDSDGSGFPDLKGKPAAIKEFVDAIQKIVKKPRGKTSILTSSLTMLLVGIAEGLPLMVTLAINYWNNKALSGKATIQDFLACITMGSVTTICTEKICGLNLNQSEVGMFYINEKCSNEESVIAPNVQEALCNGIGTPILGLQRPCSSMEDALLSWASLKLGLKMESLRQEYIIDEVKELNSSEEGCGVLTRKNGESMNSSYWKGSASTILAMCSFYYDSEGVINDINEQKIVAFEQVIADMQRKHLKTVAFGYKPNVATLEETSLILLGLLGLKNSFVKSMDDCIGAGVNIKLVSGCNASELESIALECGLNISNSDSVVLGENFRNSTPEVRMEMVDRICVMVSSLPSDKLLLVKCLKEKGHIVAMVGAKTDETPAIKEAHVGIAMGNCSTEIARESSNIIISDGNFNSLFIIMKYGRCVYENIQKFIQLELTMTVAWVLINIISTIYFGDAPITTLQYFCISFIVAVPGGLALLTEPPIETLMKKSPVRPIDSIITRTMWRNIVPQALYQAAILVTFQFKGEAVLGINQKVSKTIIFNSFILCQVFNWFSARELERKNVFKGIHQNCWFWVAVVVTMVLQVVYNEFADILGSKARLDPEQWAICILIGAVSWVIDLAVKSMSDFIADQFHRSNRGSNGMTSSASSDSLINLERPLINDNFL